MTENPYAAPKTDTAEPPDDELPRRRRRIGGWLVLPAIGIVVAPVYLLDDVIDMFRGPIWAEWTTFPSIVRTRFTTMLGFDVALLVSSILLGVMFFQRRRGTPAFFIAVLLAPLAWQVFDSALFWGDVMGLRLGPDVISAAIWVPYFALSKRVKETFFR